MKKAFVLIGLFCFAIGMQAQDIKLNAPTKKGGKPVMETFSERRSERVFVKKELPVQMLSDLLWAANGFNRENKRTIPTAADKQEIEIYAMFDNGVYFYDAKTNVLKLIAKGDFRKALGQENISNSAAVSIVIVGDMNKAASRECAYFSSGCASQNISLYAASAGLGTVVRGSFNGEELAKALKLGEKKEVTMVQPVGFLK